MLGDGLWEPDVFQADVPLGRGAELAAVRGRFSAHGGVGHGSGAIALGTISRFRLRQTPPKRALGPSPWIRLMAPGLDLILAAGERLSRLVEPEDFDYYPARPIVEPARSRAGGAAPPDGSAQAPPASE